MVKFKRTKQFVKIKNKIFKVLLFPLRCICIPIYKLYEKQKQEKRYSYKTILNLVQYCIDYHLHNNDYIYIIFDDYVGEEVTDYGGYGYRNLCDISWGWNGEYKKIKKKIEHIYYYQKENYIKAVKELCGSSLTNEEKKQEFTKEYDEGKTYLVMAYYRIQDKEVCKINSKIK